VVVTAGEGLLGLAILVFLVMRLVQTRGLDRIVITPIIVAGLAAVVAASATAVVQMLAPPGAPLPTARSSRKAWWTWRCRWRSWSRWCSALFC
jgi:hypothetical protein